MGDNRRCPKEVWFPDGVRPRSVVDNQVGISADRDDMTARIDALPELLRRDLLRSLLATSEERARQIGELDAEGCGDSRAARKSRLRSTLIPLKAVHLLG